MTDTSVIIQFMFRAGRFSKSAATCQESILFVRDLAMLTKLDPSQDDRIPAEESVHSVVGPGLGRLAS